MNENDTKQELAHTMDALVTNMHREADKMYAEEAAKWVEKYGTTLLDPEKFHIFYTYQKEQERDVLIRGLVASHALNSRDKHELEMVYRHYTFYEQHVRRLIETYEGHACCADKSRYLVKAYMETIKGKSGESVQGFKPKYGHLDTWMTFLRECTGLLYGKADAYMAARQTLENELVQDAKCYAERVGEICRAHQYFKHEEVEADKRRFFFETDGQKGNVVFNGNIGYQFFLIENGEEKRLGYADDLPSWFDDLLQVIR